MIDDSDFTEARHADRDLIQVGSVVDAIHVHPIARDREVDIDALGNDIEVQQVRIEVLNQVVQEHANPTRPSPL